MTPNSLPTEQLPGPILPLDDPNITPFLPLYIPPGLSLDSPTVFQSNLISSLHACSALFEEMLPALPSAAAPPTRV